MKFLLGVGLGLGLALLFAPAEGKALRRRLLQKGSDLVHAPSQKVKRTTEALKERAGEVGARVGRQAAEAAVGGISDEVLGTKSAL